MTRTLSADRDVSPALATVDGLESVRQRVVQRLRLHRGEWFLNRDAGMPWHQEMLGHPLSAELSGRIIVDQILGVPDVIDVTDIDFRIEPANRRLRLSAVVETRFGSMQIQETMV